jgi:hypothetical protein
MIHGFPQSLFANLLLTEAGPFFFITPVSAFKMTLISSDTLTGQRKWHGQSTRQWAILPVEA